MGVGVELAITRTLDCKHFLILNLINPGIYKWYIHRFFSSDFSNDSTLIFDRDLKVIYTN